MRRLLRTLLPTFLAAALLSTAACRSFVQEEDLSDQAVKARIESILRGRRDLDLKYVTVDVNTAVATISGIVPSRDQARMIRRLAAAVKGVEQVLNNLVIQE
jgi:osmotically-inducible protein OsmY